MEIPDVLGANFIEIDPEVVEGGKKYTIYRNGRPCKVARLDGLPAERVAGFQALLTDIHKMRAYLSLACEIASETLKTESVLNTFDSGDRNQVVCSSLYLSAITLYGKCFTEAKGRRVKLEESQLKRRLSPDQVEIHDKVKYLRDNWTGHGGVSDHESLITVVAFSEREAVPMFIAQGVAITPVEEMQDILSLCDPMIELVEELKKKNEADVFKNKDTLEFLANLRETAIDHVFVPDIVRSKPAGSAK
ncbi:hypothetical protein [Pseudomonas sp. NPDC088444]|uniref:hypothetical protein n=1 Tax=Pseudomonas sp. NPDC088444 TaxID=3364456 RepID=UPI00384F8057